MYLKIDLTPKSPRLMLIGCSKARTSNIRPKMHPLERKKEGECLLSNIYLCLSALTVSWSDINDRRILSSVSLLYWEQNDIFKLKIVI